ncbi:hypothetical protein SOM59_17045 [Pseudomonas coleopterorum]|uniref:hypothetical protein n=1 Tax=Pseudomonas coleopterorum TaxID=1605838 RepID=UPI002A6B35B2|nr:hypothetical protein [Pseudomonas coleopterorum]MDY1018797.1 hypothetical protein [Pseudomonas coleopterorum]
MWVLDGGRKHFLEFLRNTSIQFFLMVLVAVSGGKLNALVLKHDYKNAFPMGLITAVILLLLWLAAHANIKSFFVEFKSGATPGLKPYLDGLPDQNLRTKNRLTLVYLAKHGKSAVAEAGILILGFYFSIVFGAFYSFESAQRFLSEENDRSCLSAVQSNESSHRSGLTVYSGNSAK